jgi:hypothetical protein
MLLGMKGQLSEAELHLIGARLRGGILAKAARGLPVGLVYDAAGNVTLDPDTGVRRAVSHLFTTFTATGSARAVVKTFTAEDLTFPMRHRGGPRSGELYWTALTHDRVLKVLHNPRYAGAYCYGRSRHYQDADGHHHSVAKPREEWTTLIPEAHPGYITFEQYEANLAILTANAAAHRKAGPPREGPALLQGLQPGRTRPAPDQNSDDNLRHLPITNQRHSMGTHPRLRLHRPQKRHRRVRRHPTRRHRKPLDTNTNPNGLNSYR